MVCSEGDQLLGADFHAVLGKVEADMLQITKEWNWEWIIEEKGYFYKKIAASNDGSARKYLNVQGWSLNFTHIRAKFKDKVLDVSDSNQNIKTCKSKLKLSEFKPLYIKSSVKDECM